MQIYSGPGKVYHSHALGNFAFHADGENGQVKFSTVEKHNARATATHGYLRRTLDDQIGEITLSPFDLWALLPVLFPAYLGVTTNGNNGALLIGTRPHDTAGGGVNLKAATKIWTPDGRLYNAIRTAITQHPNLKLGVGQSLYESMKITALWDALNPIGANGNANFYSVTENGAADPDVVGFAPDFINGHWLASWGNIVGFQAMEVEDFWTLSVSAKYSPLTVQKLTRHFKLDSVEFMVKGRLTGPTHTQITSIIQLHTLGGTLAEAAEQDLVLTGPQNKTITLKDCELVLDNQGFEFGGTRLGTGEAAFVTKLDFTAGVPQPALVFSA